MLSKDAVALPTHSLFRILSHRIATDSIPNGFNSNGRQGTSNLTLKRCLVTLFIGNNDNNKITFGKAVNAMLKLIHGIEVDANKVKIDPCKIKQHKLEVLKYIKGVK